MISSQVLNHVCKDPFTDGTGEQMGQVTRFLGLGRGHISWGGHHQPTIVCLVAPKRIHRIPVSSQVSTLGTESCSSSEVPNSRPVLSEPGVGESPGTVRPGWKACVHRAADSDGRWSCFQPAMRGRPGDRPLPGGSHPRRRGVTVLSAFKIQRAQRRLVLGPGSVSLWLPALTEGCPEPGHCGLVSVAGEDQCPHVMLVTVCRAPSWGACGRAGRNSTSRGTCPVPHL